MKWEDIYKKLCGYAIVEGSPLANKIKIVLEGELHNKVIIHKGDNRHPYADVLHKIAEGAQGQRKLYSNISPWEDYEFTCDEYRIKPSEPIYMYQFAYLPMGSTQYEISEYMTEEEAEKSFRLMPCEKIEATKKECK